MAAMELLSGSRLRALRRVSCRLAVVASVAAPLAAPATVAADPAAPTPAPSFGISTQIAANLTSQPVGVLRSHLPIGEARLVIPYDVLNRGAWRRYGCLRNVNCVPHEVKQWITTESTTGLAPFLVLGPSEHNSRAPAVSGGPNSFASSFRRIVRAFPTVHKWGAWNEPDIAASTRSRPRLAARYWIAARDALRSMGRSDPVVAGEFASLPPSSVAPGGYFTQYNNEIQSSGVGPTIWSLHAYQDVVDRKSSETRRLLSVTSPSTKVDLTEEAVVLHGIPGLNGHANLQRAAAAEFLRLSTVSSRIIGLDYYVAAPAHGGWNTSLASKGGLRPAVCVLASLPQQDCTGSSLVH